LSVWSEVQIPLPLTVSCFSKIQIGFTFLVPAHLGSPGKRAVKQVCVCVLVLDCVCFVANEYSRSVSQSVFKRPKKVDMKLSDVHEFQLFAVQQSFAAVYGITLYATPLFFGLLGRTACMHPSHASRRCGLLLYTLIFSASGTRPQSGDMN